MSNLINKYENQKALAVRLAKEAEEALKESRLTLKEILDTAGKGPHLINGQRVNIVNRRGAYTTMDENVKVGRPRKNPVVAAVSAEPAFCAPVSAPSMAVDSTDDAE